MNVKTNQLGVEMYDTDKFDVKELAKITGFDSSHIRTILCRAEIQPFFCYVKHKGKGRASMGIYKEGLEVLKHWLCKRY